MTNCRATPHAIDVNQKLNRNVMLLLLLLLKIMMS